MSLTQIALCFIAVVLVILIARYVGTTARHRWLLGGAGVGVVALVGGWYWLFPPDDSIRTFGSDAEGWSVRSVAFSPDGRSLLAGTSGGKLSLWNVATGAALRHFDGDSTGDVNSLAFSPDGRTVVSGGHFSLKLWDVATGRPVRTFDDPRSEEIESVAFSPDGRTVLAGGWDHTPKLWDVATGAPLRTFTGHSTVINAVAFSPDGLTALSGSSDRTLRLWDVATGEERRSFTASSAVTSVAVSPDGLTALTGGYDPASLILWELATGRQIRFFRGHPGVVTSVAFSRDGRTALSGGRKSSPHNDLLQFLFPSVFGGDYDRTVRLWEVATGKQLRVFTGHSRRINSVALSPDGRTAASGSYDIKLWDLTGL